MTTRGSLLAAITAAALLTALPAPAQDAGPAPGAGAGTTSRSHACPEDPAIERIAASLTAEPLPEGGRVAGRGCTPHGGGQFWFDLVSSDGTTLRLFLAPPGAVEHAFKKTRSFAVYYGKPGGSGDSNAASLMVQAAADRIEAADRGEAVRFPRPPERETEPEDEPRAEGHDKVFELDNVYPDSVSCPKVAVIEALHRKLEGPWLVSRPQRLPLPGGFEMVRQGCTADEGGQFWFMLSNKTSMVLFLLGDPARTESPEALTPSFAFRHRVPVGEETSPEIDETVATFLDLLRQYDTGAAVVFPVDASLELPATRWIFIGVALLLLALVILLLVPRRDLAGASTAFLLAAALTVFGATTWLSPAWVLLWALPPLGLLLGLIWLRDLPRRYLAEALGLFLLALAIRWWAVPEVPTNQHTSFLGPLDAAVPAFERRDEGIYLLWRLIDSTLFPVSTALIFAVHRVAGAFAVFLLHLALRLGGRRLSPCSRWSPLAIGIFSVAFAVDPFQARLATSDAPHVWSLLCFALAAFFYLRVAALPQTTSKARAAGGAVLVFVFAALPGIIREEQMFTPLILLAMLASWHGLRRRTTWVGPRAVNVVVVLGVLSGFFRNLLYARGARPEVLDLDGLMCWLRGIISHVSPDETTTDAFTMAWNNDGGFGSMLVAQDVCVLAAIAVFGWLFRKRLRAGAVLLATLVTFALRIPTSWCALPLGQDWADSRYDTIVELAVLFLAAVGFALVVSGTLSLARRFLRTPWQQTAAAILGTTAVLAGVRAWSAPYTPPYRMNHGYQEEYLFVARHIGELDPRCQLWVVGQDGYPWFDDVLAYPHGTLAYSYPEVEWRYITHRFDAPIPPDEGVCLYFLYGTLCNLAVDVDPERDPYNPTAVENAHRLCEMYRSAAVETIAEQEGPGIPIQRPFTNNRLKLGLYKLDPEKLRAISIPPPGFPGKGHEEHRQDEGHTPSP